MSRRFLVASVLLAVLLAGGAYWLSRGEPQLRSSVQVTEALGGDTVGYRRATAPRAFRFPEDHGPHPDYKTEWWYVTGNLKTNSGRHIGYQLTLFRYALASPDSVSTKQASAWGTHQLYMGHFALTDVANEQFYAFERFSRGAVGLAGATASDSVRVWLEDWSFRGSSGKLFPLTLRAQEGEVAVRLRLTPDKPLVRQGEQGLSKKGPGVGNASYYYSFTRLKTSGTVHLPGETLQVRGQSWLDREWSTSALSEQQTGWDWFALQLSNGYDLMYYRLRRKDGTTSPYSEGVLVDPQGAVRRLSAKDVQLTVLERWKSGERTYPVRWRLRVPTENIALTVVPYLRDQELDASVRYWEGAVNVRGAFQDTPVQGEGYLEMTGYGKQGSTPLS